MIDQQPASLMVGQQVVFDECDGLHDRSLGVITRVWPNGKYVSIRSDGRLFVRLIKAVTVCV